GAGPAAGVHGCAVVERGARQPGDRMPRGIVRQLGVDVGRDEAEVGGGELALPWNAIEIAERAELFEVRQLADVHLLRELAADRPLEVLRGIEVAAGQSPCAELRLACA